jgi:surfactin synthase thioesterase subunit
VSNRAGSNREELWLERVLRSPRAALRIFCFPYAGGDARAFRDWQQHLPEVEVCPVHLPGRGRRFNEPLFTRLRLLVDALAKDISWEEHSPFALYGHSMGALICFELARELHRKYGVHPVHIFVSGRRAPHLISVKRRTHDLPREEFIAELKNLNGTPQEVLAHAEMMDVFLPVLRADFELIETYEYRFDERLSCPITAYGGLLDQDVPVESLRQWGEHTWTACRVRMFPGGHFFIHTAQTHFVDVLRRDLLGTLNPLRQQSESDTYTRPTAIPT